MVQRPCPMNREANSKALGTWKSIEQCHLEEECSVTQSRQHKTQINTSMNWKSRLGLIDTTYPTLRNQLAIGADSISCQTTRTTTDMGTSH